MSIRILSLQCRNRWEKIFEKWAPIPELLEFLARYRTTAGQDADADAVTHHESELCCVLDYESALSTQNWLAGEVYYQHSNVHIPTLTVLQDYSWSMSSTLIGSVS